MNENSSTPQLLPLKYQEQLQAHVEMAERIEQIASQDNSDFIKLIANLGVLRAKTFHEALATRLKHSTVMTEEQLKRIETTEKKKARAYPKIIVNQTLVLMCTTLDIYLQQTMKTILQEDNNAIQALCKPNDIQINDAIGLAVSNQLVDSVRGKILGRFDYAGIEDKLKYLNKCGISTDRIFASSKGYPRLLSLTTPSERRSLLLKAYAMRHSIVHKGDSPINRSDDLSDIKIYFGEFMFKIANICNDEKNIPSDLDLLIKGLKKSD